MRASVTAAWPAFCQNYEGVCFWMYLDTKSKVTTGTGNLIDTVAAAQNIEWVTKAGTIATAAEVAAEWRRVKALTKYAHLNGLNAVWSSSAQLLLTRPTVDALLLEVTATFWARVAKTLPAIETFPADAQLALMDEAWQNGAAFLDLKQSDGSYTWNGTRSSVLAQDWAKAASHVPGTGSRADARKRLFNNAAAVVKLRVDPAVLWNTKIPTAAPPVVVPPPVTPPKEPDVSVAFRGGRTCTCVATSLPLVEKDMIRRGLIKKNIDIFQLGYNGGGVAASAGTHDAGGNTDVGQYSDAQIQVWREWGWTIQHRTRAQGFDADHGHGWPLGCTHLSAGGRNQAAQWARRQNGLASHGPISGKYPVDDWKTAMKKQLAAQQARDEAAAEAARQKELELPTPAEVTKDVLTRDGLIENVFTGNEKNEFVSLATAVVYLGKRTQAAEEREKRIEADLADVKAALAALVARFPGQPAA